MNKRILVLGLAMVVGILVAAVVGPAEAEAGSLAGPGVLTVGLDSGESKTYVDIFEAKKPAAVIVEGTGTGGDIDCYLSTQEGHVVDTDVSPHNSCSFMWTPGYTQGFKLRVVNAGRGGTLATVTSN